MAAQPMTVGDLMTRDLITVSEEDNLASVQMDMELFRKRHLPVVDGKRLVGLLTHRDLLRMSVASLDRNSISESINQSHMAGTFVAEVMTRDLITVTPNTNLAEAAQLLADSHRGCLPVVEGDELVGIITEHDFVRLSARLLSDASSG